MKQFPDVSAKYGAPMGRPELLPEGPAKVRLFRVKLVDGDYDDGGAYWGGPPGEPLYCARSDGVQLFTRANTREEAKELFKEAHPQLTFYR